jgi:hypothetical protein
MKSKLCSKIVVGRKGKLFCLIRRKNYCHINLRKTTEIRVQEIETILHRNRSILLEIM